MSKYFSIIIPALTNNPFIHDELLPGLEAQTYHDFEAIIIGNEAESFGKELKLYPWLRVISSTKPPGVKRDLAAKKANGDILAFIDDDTMPKEDWLTLANKIFSEKKLTAAGGPGILPLNATFFEKVFDAILCSTLGSGSYTYRFKPEKERFTDDFPSMNLFIKKDAFLSLNGFDNNYWPGEDSKLGEKLRKQLNAHIFYYPGLAIFHHRRSNPFAYLRQHWRYGFMRGMFFSQGDQNSMRPIYLAPFLFFVYLIVYIELLIASQKVAGNNMVLYMGIPLGVYFAALIITAIQSFLKSLNPLVSLSVIILLPITHIIYGIGFASGYTSVFLKRREKAIQKK